MLDHRLDTFLTLYEQMNYRVTAEILHITQPAVTQHIHYLEREYGCKLFEYDGKTLAKTENAHILAKYARGAMYNEESFRKTIKKAKEQHIRIGATKTIGDYILPRKLTDLLHDTDIRLSLTVDNTDVLLQMLDKALLDFAIVEGTFDRDKYVCRLLRKEPFVGICAKNHPFAEKSIELSDVFSETLLVREAGSGTRAVLEQMLQTRSYTLKSFDCVHCISNFEAMKTLIAANCGVTFAYRAVAGQDERLATFEIKELPVERELNYVYLKYTEVGKLVDLLE